MRRSKTTPIRELVTALMQKYGADEKIAEVRLLNAWEELLGKRIMQFTKNLYIKDRKLFVTINSSIVKAEINMIKNQLIAKLNEKAGKNLIDVIIIR